MTLADQKNRAEAGLAFSERIASVWSGILGQLERGDKLYTTTALDSIYLLASDMHILLTQFRAELTQPETGDQ